LRRTPCKNQTVLIRKRPQGERRGRPVDLAAMPSRGASGRGHHHLPQSTGHRRQYPGPPAVRKQRIGHHKIHAVKGELKVLDKNNILIMTRTTISNTGLMFTTTDVPSL